MCEAGAMRYLCALAVVAVGVGGGGCGLVCRSKCRNRRRNSVCWIGNTPSEDLWTPRGGGAAAGGMESGCGAGAAWARETSQPGAAGDVLLGGSRWGLHARLTPQVVHGGRVRAV